jgi:hypothetical protein
LIYTLVVELVDTQDLKSCGPKRPYGFDSRLRYNSLNNQPIGTMHHHGKIPSNCSSGL